MWDARSPWPQSRAKPTHFPRISGAPAQFCWVSPRPEFDSDRSSPVLLLLRQFLDDRVELLLEGSRHRASVGGEDECDAGDLRILPFKPRFGLAPNPCGSPARVHRVNLAREIVILELEGGAVLLEDVQSLADALPTLSIHWHAHRLNLVDVLGRPLELVQCPFCGAGARQEIGENIGVILIFVRFASYDVAPLCTLDAAKVLGDDQGVLSIRHGIGTCSPRIQNVVDDVLAFCWPIGFDDLLDVLARDER